MGNKKNILLLAVITILAYITSFKGGWQVDDYPNIIQNSFIHIKSLDCDSIINLFLSNKFRFVSLLTFALNYRFFDLNVGSYHVVNFFIHLCCAIVVYYLALELISRTLPLKAGSNKKKVVPSHKTSPPSSVAFWVASLWAAAPIQTMAVTYIVQRIASLAGLFYFISILFYLKWRYDCLANDNYNVYHKYLKLIIWILSAVLAFLSKENTFILPFTLLVTEFFIIQRGDTKWLKNKALSISLLFFFPIVIYISRIGFSNIIKSGILADIIDNSYPEYDFSPLQKVIIESRILFDYISKIIFSFVGRFHIFYDYNWINAPFQIWTWICLALVPGSIIYAVYIRKKYPIITFSIFFFFLGHIIESSFIGLHLAFEHRNYIPSFGIVLLLVYVVFSINFRYRSLILISFLAFSLLNTSLLNVKYQRKYANAVYDYQQEYKGCNYDIAFLASDSMMRELGFKDSKKILDGEWHNLTQNIHRKRLLKYLNDNIIMLYSFRCRASYLSTFNLDELLNIVKDDITTITSDQFINKYYYHFMVNKLLNVLYKKYISTDEKYFINTTLKFDKAITNKYMYNIELLVADNVALISKLEQTKLTADEYYYIDEYLKKNQTDE